MSAIGYFMFNKPTQWLNYLHSHVDGDGVWDAYRPSNTTWVMPGCCSSVGWPTNRTLSIFSSNFFPHMSDLVARIVAKMLSENLRKGEKTFGWKPCDCSVAQSEHSSYWGQLLDHFIPLLSFFNNGFSLPGMLSFCDVRKGTKSSQRSLTAPVDLLSPCDHPLFRALNMQLTVVGGSKQKAKLFSIFDDYWCKKKICM